MLKKVYFEGVIMVDLLADDKEKTNCTLEYEYGDAIREAVSEFGNHMLEITAVPIKSLKDIPQEWQNSIPYGEREENNDRTCLEIFNEDILPKLPPTENPNQKKFGFWEDAKKKT